MEKAGKTVIIAEHRLVYYLMELADRVIYMKDGRIANDFSIEFKIEETQLHQMDLVPFYLVEFEEGMVETINKQLQFNNISFSYGKKFIDIPDITVPYEFTNCGVFRV